MPFETGARLGPYEIVAPLGAGGMGEVYRARDTRLDRTVAIKILSDALAADAESRQRFEQEARSIAALNDPHICTIHDVGRHGDLDYLVLEHLDGETLADRLKRAPGPTTGESLAIAIQIAEALDRAHRAGVVHRDLKPGNVMLVRRAGSAAADVKLLDFGLATRASATGRPRALDATMAATVAPTMVATQPPSTPSSPGGFSGTVQYMAPEQLDGLETDQRVDVFAFGCLLYEMLAGRRAFEGATVVTVVAAIMSSEPAPLPALQADPRLDHVVRRCFEKSRDRRWQNMGDVAGELRWIADHPAPATPALAAPAPSGRWKAVAIAALLVAGAAAGAAALAVWGRPEVGAASSYRFEIATTPTDEPAMALSPDGTQLAFVANQDRVPMLWVRALNDLTSRVLAGTEGARFPFWSPDGQSIGFFADNALKRIEATGGTALVVTDAQNGRGGTWSADGVILFSPGVSAPVMRVPSTGGRPVAVTQVNAGTGPDHRFPQFLPDGRRFLFSSTLGTPETNGVYLASLDGTPPVRILAGSAGRFVAPDMLVVRRQDTLQAYGFDLDAGTVSGEPVIVAAGMTDANGSWSASQSGDVLAYRPGTTQRRQLTWVSRTGMPLGTVGEPDLDSIASPELRDDESAVLVFRQTPDNDIWLIEFARSLARRVTSGLPADAHPVWDPDGAHVVFVSRRHDPPGPARQAVNGGRAEPLFPKGERGSVLAYTRDGRYVLLRREDADGATDLVARPIGEGREITVAATPAEETEGQFSPDGQWVAFVSFEGGRPEVYVQSFPEGRARTQISIAGGSQVRWSRDGREIFYVAPDGKMMAVAVTLGGASPVVQAPAALFQTYLASGTNVLGMKPQYAVARDGRFLLNNALETASPPIVVTVNWRDAARRR